MRVIINSLYSLTWVQINGIVYKTGGAVVLRMNLTPVFGVIIDVIVMDVNDYYIVCEEMVTEHCDHHYHSYKITQLHPKCYIICKTSDLFDHTILKYYLVENV